MIRGIQDIFSISFIKYYCCCLVTKSCPTLSNPMDCSTPVQASLYFTVFRSLLILMSIESVMPSNHLIFCCPLFLPLIFPSIRVFPKESAHCIRWPKYWSFSFIISPSSEYSGYHHCIFFLLLSSHASVSTHIHKCTNMFIHWTCI